MVERGRANALKRCISFNDALYGKRAMLFEFRLCCASGDTDANVHTRCLARSCGADRAVRERIGCGVAHGMRMHGSRACARSAARACRHFALRRDDRRHRASSCKARFRCSARIAPHCMDAGRHARSRDRASCGSRLARAASRRIAPCQRATRLNPDMSACIVIRQSATRSGVISRTRPIPFARHDAGFFCPFKRLALTLS
jgi:hypothetical protein